MILDLSRPPSDPVEVIPRRKLHDRGSIGPRSWSSSTKHLDRPMECQESGRSDRDQAISVFYDDPMLLVSPRGVR